MGLTREVVFRRKVRWRLSLKTWLMSNRPLTLQWINISHTHTPTENNTPDTDTHTRQEQHPKPPNERTHKYSTTFEGGATTVRATSHPGVTTEKHPKLDHRRFIYKGDTSTHVEGTGPRGALSERAKVRRHYGPLCSTLVAAKSGSIDHRPIESRIRPNGGGSGQTRLNS